MPEIDEIREYLLRLQRSICDGLEVLDGNAGFISDTWQRPEGGGGDTRVIQQGKVFEKGGVNYSCVYGKLPDILKRETVQADHFLATGVSIVIHPQHPFVPIIHMNVRYFEMRETADSPVLDRWFGGGIDLSPAYPNEADTRFFHGSLKAACDPYGAELYPKYKKWCDDYFTITHRKEMRGVGGIFFDHIRPGDGLDFESLFGFWQSVGNAFLPAYTELVNRNKDRPYTDAHKSWQYIRRGRYAEFNLVYDRGTTFGLKTNGRIESILMSLPPHAEWKYNHQPETGSEEAEALSLFQPRDWY